MGRGRAGGPVSGVMSPSARRAAATGCDGNGRALCRRADSAWRCRYGLPGSRAACPEVRVSKVSTTPVVPDSTPSSRRWVMTISRLRSTTRHPVRQTLARPLLNTALGTSCPVTGVQQRGTSTVSTPSQPAPVVVPGGPGTRASAAAAATRPTAAAAGSAGLPSSVVAHGNREGRRSPGTAHQSATHRCRPRCRQRSPGHCHVVPVRLSR